MNSVGRASYVERNYWMIDGSAFVIVKINEEKNGLKAAQSSYMIMQ